MDWAKPRQTAVEVTSTDTSFGTSFFPFSKKEVPKEVEVTSTVV